MRRILTVSLALAFCLAGTAPPAHAGEEPKNEEGFVSLFNGKDFTGWRYYKEKLDGKTKTADERFTIENGVIVANVGKGIKDLFTQADYPGEFHLKLEFRASLKSDSGVYLRSPGHQLQVRDYIRRGERKQLKNFRNDDWNELELILKNGIVSTTVNGKKLTDKDSLTVKLENGRPTVTLNGASVEPGNIQITNMSVAKCYCNGEFLEDLSVQSKNGGIGLQAEDGKFEFRRIRIKVLPVPRATGDAPTREGAANGGEKTDKKKLLLITESRGFRHGCVTRNVKLLAPLDPKNLPKIKDFEFQVIKNKDGTEMVKAFFVGRVTSMKPFDVKHEGETIARVEPCVVEITFQELAAKNGFEVTCTQDSRAELNGDNLKNYDAVFFYTTGSLPLSDGQKSDLLAFVRSGKGFGGSHCATDTFYDWKEYGELIGGYFDGHPWHQKIKVLVEDPKNPATKHLGESFEVTDEIYQFKGPYSREKLRILLRLDMGSVKDQGKRKDGDNALAWIHQFGKGRVFYTALGHRDEVWRDDRFQQHVIGGLRYMFGLEKADDAPSGGKKE